MSPVRDLRHAARALARKPRSAILAALTLALGIGAATTVFGVVRSVLLRPLDYDDPGRLVAVFTTENDGRETRNPTSPADFADWRRHARTLEQITAARPWSPTLTGGETADQLSGLQASPSLFGLLGVDATLGRTFRPGDDARVAVLRHDLWQRRFGADPEVVGRSVVLDGEPYTVIGVMPPGFRFPPFWAAEAEIWSPLVLPAEDEASRDARFLRVFARLAPAASLPAARAELEAVAARLSAEHPKTNEGVGAWVEPLREPMVEDSRRTLAVLFAAVGFLLLIACANVANLLLARAHRRRAEIALRGALGAGRATLVREVMTESALVAAGGCATGTLVAWIGLDTARDLIPPGLLPRLDHLSVDWTVLGFAVAASALSALLAGALPALRVTRRDPQELLRSAGRTTRSGRDLFRPGLVVAEVALALVLLAGAGLMARSFAGLLALDPGFRPEGLLTATVPLGGSPYEAASRQSAFFDQAAARVASLPGVERAAFVNHLPIGGDLWRSPFTVEGGTTTDADDRAVLRTAGPGYFETLGIPVLRGRTFDGSDRAGTLRVAVVNRSMARLIAARRAPSGTGAGPVGARIKLGGADAGTPWLTVVAVVDDTRQEHLVDAPRPEVIFPYAQNPFAWLTTAQLLVKVDGDRDPRTLVGPIRGAIAAISPSVPVVRPRTMEEILGSERAGPRFQALLLGLFALCAVLLSAVGLYGVVSFLVGERRPELAVRSALGARRTDLIRLVLARGAALTSAGLGLGLLGALGLGRLIDSLLYRVAPDDPRTLAAVVALLAAISLAACLGPALRAARVPPSEALRGD